MRPDNFEFFSALLLKRTGLSIGLAKQYLADTRLVSVAKRHKLANADAVVMALRRTHDPHLLRDALNAMMTHESSFFRDLRPFEDFRKLLLPLLLERRSDSRRLRIWCTAASTGQEPYSVAMIAREEARRLAGWTVEIVGTDIAAGALDYARNGLYTHFEVQRGMPVQYLVKYFTKEGSSWRIAKELRSAVTYCEFNLLDDPAALGTFDVVFCRNVLIYFDAETKSRVLERIAGQMPADGFLVLGGAETVIGVTDRFSHAPGCRGICTPGTGTAVAADLLAAG